MLRVPESEILPLESSIRNILRFHVSKAISRKIFKQNEGPRYRPKHSHVSTNGHLQLPVK